MEPSSLLLWWPSLTKDIQTEQLLFWSGMTDTEQSTTSSSNEEEEGCLFIFQMDSYAKLLFILVVA